MDSIQNLGNELKLIHQDLDDGTLTTMDASQAVSAIEENIEDAKKRFSEEGGNPDSIDGVSLEGIANMAQLARLKVEYRKYREED